MIAQGNISYDMWNIYIYEFHVNVTWLTITILICLENQYFYTFISFSNKIGKRKNMRRCTYLIVSTNVYIHIIKT